MGNSGHQQRLNEKCGRKEVCPFLLRDGEDRQKGHGEQCSAGTDSFKNPEPFRAQPVLFPEIGKEEDFGNSKVEIL